MRPEIEPIGNVGQKTEKTVDDTARVVPVASGTSESGVVATLYSPSFDPESAKDWLLANGFNIHS